MGSITDLSGGSGGGGGVYEHLGSLEFLEQFNNCLLWSYLHMMNWNQ
jgi:hypothetical protein